MVHAPVAIEELAELDSGSGIAAVARPGRDIEDHSRKSNCIVIADGSLVAETADPIDIEFFGQRAPSVLAFSGGLGKAAVEIGFERTV